MIDARTDDILERMTLFVPMVIPGASMKIATARPG
jgi:hypothetical protein